MTENNRNDKTWVGGKEPSISLVTTAALAVLLLVAGAGTANAAHSITTCADDVTSSGLHTVDSDITDGGVTSCIDINASDVVLEGNDNTIDGLDQDSGSIGVSVTDSATLTNVTVRNLTVTNWEDGVSYDDADDGKVTNVNASANSNQGIRLFLSSNNDVTSNTAIGNTNQGIELVFSSDNNSVTSNTVTGNGRDGIRLFSSSDNNNVTSNTATGNDRDGIRLFSSSDNNNVTSNTATGNDNSGIGITSSGNNTVTSNTATGNDKNGIDLFSSSNNNTVTANTATGNSIDGVRLYSSSDNNVMSNNASGNDQDGLEVEVSSDNNSVVLNGATGNGNHGISIAGSSDNNVTANIATANTDQGIRLSSSTNNTVTANNATGNGDNGILLTLSGGSGPSVGNNLTDNMANDNGDNGIWVEVGNGNFLTDNTANDNGDNGIYLGGGISAQADGNTLVDNEVTSNGGTGDSGIYLANADDNTLVNNMARDSFYGVWLVSSVRNNLTDNLVENNPRAGIYLGGISAPASDNTLVNNTARGSEYGIWVRNSRNNDISESLAENNQVGIEFAEDNFFTAATLASSGNTFTNDTSKENTDWDFVIETDDPFIIPFASPLPSDLPVTNLNIGDSTKANTLLSFDGDDAQIRSNTTPPSPPAGLVGIGRYFEAENNSANGFLNMTASYNDTDFMGNESELGLYGYNSTTGLWGLLPSDIDETNNTVSSEIVDFSTFGILKQARGPFFDVEITGTNSPVLEGQKVNVDANVTNTGNDTATQIIQLDIDGLVVDSEEITLGPGESTLATFMWHTRVGDAGDYTATVSSDDDNDTAPIRVTETCINRRDLGRGQEESECSFDRDISRGGSREDLDRNTGRGGTGEHRDSATSRRNRGRGSTRGGR